MNLTEIGEVECGGRGEAPIHQPTSPERARERERERKRECEREIVKERGAAHARESLLQRDFSTLLIQRLH